MTSTITRRVAAGVAATGAAAAIAVGVATTASAAPGDPVTGGSTTIGVPAASAYLAARAGIVVNAIKPASSAYAPDTKTVDYTLPVSGGDGSVKAGYGSITHDGGLVVTNVARNRSVSLTSVTFSPEDYVLRTTPVGASTPVELAVLSGDSTVRTGADGQQTLSSTSISLTPAGASYLDKSLATSAFKAGQKLGSFTTTFTNAEY